MQGAGRGDALFYKTNQLTKADFKSGERTPSANLKAILVFSIT